MFLFLRVEQQTKNARWGKGERGSLENEVVPKIVFSFFLCLHEEKERRIFQHLITFRELFSSLSVLLSKVSPKANKNFSCSKTFSSFSAFHFLFELLMFPYSTRQTHRISNRGGTWLRLTFDIIPPCYENFEALEALKIESTKTIIIGFGFQWSDSPTLRREIAAVRVTLMNGGRRGR